MQSPSGPAATSAGIQVFRLVQHPFQCPYCIFVVVGDCNCCKASLHTREGRGVPLGEARGLLLRGVGTKRFSREQGKREVTGVSPEDTSLWQVWRLGQCQHLRAVRRVLYWCFRLRAYQGMPWFNNPSAWPGTECQVGNGCHSSQSTRCHRSGINKDRPFAQHKTQWSGTCFQSRS